MKLLNLFILLVFLSWTFFASSQEALTLIQKEEKMNQAYNSKNYSRFQNWAYKVLSEDDAHLSALYKLGVYHLERGQVGIARILFERAIQHHPRQASLYYQQGLIALKENEKQKALLSFEESLKKDNSYVPAVVALASVYMESFNVKKALPLLHASYSEPQLSKYFAPIAYNYALALRLSGKSKQARKIYQSIVKERRENSLIMMNYALLLMEDFKDTKGAQKALNRADIIAQNSRERSRVQVLKKKLKKKR